MLLDPEEPDAPAPADPDDDDPDDAVPDVEEPDEPELDDPEPDDESEEGADAFFSLFPLSLPPSFDADAFDFSRLSVR